MLSPAYPIVTERLALRPLGATDADAVAAYQSLPDVCRYIPYEPRDRAAGADLLASPRIRSTFESVGDVITLGVLVRGTDTLIGDVILRWVSDVHRTGEIGYVFHPAHRGHGYATEACAALLRLAFEDMQLRRVIARIDERNEASAAVLDRLGLRAEARLVENEWFKGEWTTEIDYAILESEWRDRPG